MICDRVLHSFSARSQKIKNVLQKLVSLMGSRSCITLPINRVSSYEFLYS